MAKAALMSAHLGPLHLEFNIQDQAGNMRSSTLVDAKRSPADTSALNPFDRSRIYFHLDCLKDSESIKSVKVEVKANHNTQTLTIPVMVPDKRDTTLHKLAARAMLEDLERGRSHIHLGSNRPLPGSWQETSMVRKEAEQIACKWSLVSKWTSFFLAEEPYTPTGDDIFMDGIVEIKVPPGDDLLQPHGVVEHIASIEFADPDTFATDDFTSKRPVRVHSGTLIEDPSALFPRKPRGDLHVRNSTSSRGKRGDVKSWSPDWNYSVEPGAYGGVDPSLLVGNSPAIIVHSDMNVQGWQGFQNHDQGNSSQPQSPDHHKILKFRQEPRKAPHTKSYEGVRRSAELNNQPAASSTTGASRIRAWGNDQDDALRERLGQRFDSSPGTKVSGDENNYRSNRNDGDTKVGPKLVISTFKGCCRSASKVANWDLTSIDVDDFDQESDSVNTRPLTTAHCSTSEPPSSAREASGSQQGMACTPCLWTPPNPPKAPSSSAAKASAPTPPHSSPTAPPKPTPPDGWVVSMASPVRHQSIPLPPRVVPLTDQFRRVEPAVLQMDVTNKSLSYDDSAPAPVPFLVPVPVPEDQNTRHTFNHSGDVGSEPIEKRSPSLWNGGSQKADSTTYPPGPSNAFSALERLDSDSESADYGCTFDPVVTEREIITIHPQCAPYTPAQEANQIQQQARPTRRPQPLATFNDPIMYPAWPTARDAYNPPPGYGRPSLPPAPASVPLPVPVPGDDQDTDKPDPDRAFVASLLNFQQYDGSIDFSTWETAESVLGKTIADALRPLQQAWPALSDRGLWTAAVHVLLKRRFQACKALWGLMAIKTANYCRKHAEVASAHEPGWGLLEVVGKVLEGLELPFHGEQQQQQQPQGEEERAVDDVVPEIVTVEPPAHERIPEKSPEERAKKDRKKRKEEKAKQGGKGSGP